MALFNSEPDLLYEMIGFMALRYIVYTLNKRDLISFRDVGPRPGLQFKGDIFNLCPV